ncbi:MAG: polysaccharide biosynthesis protein [Phycisphaerales bacterium]|nr:polysaccharide biosynthesis protein [Phycisphaerales bacterium]
MKTAILVGTPAACDQLERQLGLLADAPIILGRVHCGPDAAGSGSPVLGTLTDLELVCARRRPQGVLVTLPSAMKDLLTSIRTRVRRLGIPDRFLPTLDDQLAGVGPRTEFEVDLTELVGRPQRHLDEALVCSAVEGRRVLVTGAGGSIGGELCRILANFAPAKLILVERSENALFEIDRQIARRFPPLARRACLHDVVDAGATHALWQEEQPDLVIHAAAHKHVPMMEDHPGLAVDNNLFGTKSALDASLACNAERFVMVSTDKAVNPTSIMGMTKRLAELYVQHCNRSSSTACSVVRFGNVLGSSGSVLETWKKQIADGGPLTVTDPRMTRYFMSIPEAASLVIQAAALTERDAKAGEVFVLDMGSPFRIVDLAERFVRMHGLDPILENTPNSAGARAGEMSIICTGARPGEKLFEELALDAETIHETRHPDIRIWGLPTPERSYIDRMLATLAPQRRSRDGAQVARVVRELVPEAPVGAANLPAVA